MDSRRALRWFLALVFAIAVAASSNAGPVLVNLPGDHGVHASDVVAVIAAVVWVVLGDPRRSGRESGEND